VCLPIGELACKAMLASDGVAGKTPLGWLGLTWTVLCITHARSSDGRQGHPHQASAGILDSFAAVAPCLPAAVEDFRTCLRERQE
jgi:hypothetical protein